MHINTGGQIPTPYFWARIVRNFSSPHACSSFLEKEGVAITLWSLEAGVVLTFEVK